MNFYITADSIPILDRWGWDEYWNAADWQKWHSLNVTKYGRATANEKFNREWERQDSFASPYNWAKYNKTFVDYFAKQGIDVSSIVSAPLIGAEKVVKGAGNAVGDIGNAVGKTGKLLKHILPIFVALLLITVLIIIYKKATKA